MTVKRLLCLVAALLLVPAVAAADDLSATLAGAGGASGLASIQTGNGSVSYALLTNGIGNVTGASIRQGATTVVDLNASSGNGSAAGTVATGADLNAINTNPAAYMVVVNGSGGTVSGPLANAGPSGGGGDDEPGTLGFADGELTALERDGGVTLMVTRTGGTDGAVSVDYASENGTATAGEDYTAVSGTLDFADGDDTTQMIAITIADDGTAEASETFAVNLTSATGGAALGVATASVTILDNDTPCVEDATTLCLNDGRFEVKVDWATTQGTSGDGQAEPLTPDTGYFTFFNPNNVEMVVKVLDGCVINGNYWVFAGGLTNVQVEMRVRDADTGVIVPYMNPQETPFQPIQDTQAFTTSCP